MDRHRPALTRGWALALAVPPLVFLGLFFHVLTVIVLLVKNSGDRRARAEARPG